MTEQTQPGAADAPPAYPISMLVADVVGARCVRHRKTRGALAEHLGIVPSTLSRRRAGVGSWPVDDVVATAEFLGVPLADLLADIGAAVAAAAPPA